MTLDEAIKHTEEVAEENETVVNTRTFEDGYTVDEMYCDDTECINEHLARCAECAKEHRQLAGWLKDYKRLKEQEHTLDKIEEEINSQNRGTCDYFIVDRIEEIIDKYKAEMETEE